MSIEDSLRFHTPESRERGRQLFAACARDGTPFDHESEIVEPDGSRKWIRVIGEAVRDANGKIVRTHGAFQNITERKWADRAIEQSRLRFRQLADAMPQIVWTADADGTIDYANQTLSDYTGLTLDQLKIDPSFVQDVLVDPNDAVIVKTIIALAQSLGLEVTAEGVEATEQHAFLAENGCYAYQGYLFNRPLPVDQFEALLNTHSVSKPAHEPCKPS
jgi:PAS domain S-box-containing protein